MTFDNDFSKDVGLCISHPAFNYCSVVNLISPNNIVALAPFRGRYVEYEHESPNRNQSKSPTYLLHLPEQLICSNTRSAVLSVHPAREREDRDYSLHTTLSDDSGKKASRNELFGLDVLLLLHEDTHECGGAQNMLYPLVLRSTSASELPASRSDSAH